MVVTDRVDIFLNRKQLENLFCLKEFASIFISTTKSTMRDGVVLKTAHNKRKAKQTEGARDTKYTKT